MKRLSVAGIALIFLTAVLIFPAPVPSAGRDETVKVIVPAAQQKALDRMGAGLVARRSSYLVYQIPLSDRNRLAAVPGAVARPDFDEIQLNRVVIDTAGAAPEVPPSLAASRAGEGLMLIQFSAPPVDSDIALVEGAGAKIVQYVPQNAYIIWVPAGAAEAMEKASRSSAVQYYGPYHPYYALSPRLDEAGGQVAVTVQFYNYGREARAEAEKVAAEAARAIMKPTEAIGGRYLNVRVVVSASSLPSLAALPGVVTVEPYVEPVLFGERQDQVIALNLNVGETGPSGPGYLAWLGSQGFPTDPADYPIIDVVDDGFDTGNAASPGNSEFRQLNNPALPSRCVYAIIAAGASGFGPEGVDGHGNINCSIVGGYNDGSGSPANVDSQGYHWGLGVSPYGRIASTRIFGPSGWSFPDEDLMVSNQYAAGVRTTSNSWGADVYGAYDSDAQAYDRRTRDAQSGTPGNQEILFVFASGNKGPTTGSVGTPGTAKNVITVGASENEDSALSYTDGCGVGPSGANNIQDIIGFSSRGPCDDSRVKPEIVAPGTHIHGAASYYAGYTGSSVCDKYNPAGQTKYAESSGTSHSTPAVSGFVSLVTNFLNRIYGITAPSPALKKAYVIHSGHFLTGLYANDNLPSNAQGFGLSDLELAFKTAAERYFLDQTEILTSSGQTFELAGVVDDPGEPFRAVLVWTDPPGPTSGNAYVNDLDLEVTVNGTLYRGNNFLKGVSQTGGSPDPRNNYECVFLPAGLTGDVSITVRGTTIAGDGVPGNGDATDQDFALVVYNFDTTPWQNLIDEGFDGFDTGSRPAGWVFTNCNEDTDTYTAPAGYYGRALPSVKLDDSDDAVTTVSFANPRDLRFWTRGVGAGTTGALLVEEFYSGSYYPLVNLTTLPGTGTVEGPYSLNSSTSRLRFTYTKDSGDLAFDDVRVSEGITPSPTATPSVTPTPFGYKTPTPTASPTPTPSPSYCDASGGCDEYISRVQFNTIDNSSGCDGYADYSALSTVINRQTAYGITVTNPVPYTGDACDVWVDWNQNLSFSDAGESTTLGGGPDVFTGTITGPAGALLGETRLRVRLRYYGSVNPCGDFDYGEVEDYAAVVVPTGTPSPTPFGYKTPTPSPTVTPTPLGYKTPTPTPTPSPSMVLYDNGTIVTHFGGGYGGADASVLQTALSLNIYGFGHAFSSGYRIADDFTISNPHGWHIDTITVLDYQTYSGIPSTITGVYLQIWNGRPGYGGSSVIFGDLTTNRMTGTTWSNIYRVPDYNMTSADRPVMANTVGLNLELGPGTYWLDWMAGGSASYTGPWAPPITILGQTTTGNAIQYNTSTWNDVVDTGTGTPQGFPFVIEGVVGQPSPLPTPTPTPSRPPASPTPPPQPATPTPSPQPVAPTPSPTAIAAPSPTPTCGPDAAQMLDVIASGDYDGDGAAEIAVFRPATTSWRATNAGWYIRGLTRFSYGLAGDLPVPGDYNGDGSADASVYRYSLDYAAWYVRGITRLYYGKPGDIPVPGDYRGDGTTGFSVFRPSNGRWYIRGEDYVTFGQSGDWPAPGDYAGDGTLDVGVFRPGSGLWAVRGLTRLYFGLSGDWPVPADYSGDGAWRPAVFRPCRGMWAVRYFTRTYLGNCLDVPCPGDFDGNGTEDSAIFRAPSGLWSVRGLSRAYFGTAGDLPVTR